MLRARSSDGRLESERFQVRVSVYIIILLLMRWDVTWGDCDELRVEDRKGSKDSRKGPSRVLLAPAPPKVGQSPKR